MNMKFKVNISVNSRDLIDNKEGAELSLLGLPWDSALNISIKNPYSINDSPIKIIEMPEDKTYIANF